MRSSHQRTCPAPTRRRGPPLPRPAIGQSVGGAVEALGLVFHTGRLSTGGKEAGCGSLPPQRERVHVPRVGLLLVAFATEWISEWISLRSLTLFPAHLSSRSGSLLFSSPSLGLSLPDCWVGCWLIHSVLEPEDTRSPTDGQRPRLPACLSERRVRPRMEAGGAALLPRGQIQSQRGEHTDRRADKQAVESTPVSEDERGEAGAAEDGGRARTTASFALLLHCTALAPVKSLKSVC